jgi:hypothetical protein
LENISAQKLTSLFQFSRYEPVLGVRQIDRCRYAPVSPEKRAYQKERLVEHLHETGIVEERETH